MRRRTLITGGAGFVGTNLAGRILRGGERVIVFEPWRTKNTSHLVRARLSGAAPQEDVVARRAPPGRPDRMIELTQAASDTPPATPARP